MILKCALKIKAMKKSAFIFGFITIIFQIFAQPAFPPLGNVYTDTELPKIYIYVNPDSLAYIYSHVHDNLEYHATFVFKSSQLNDSVTNVGFSLRGNTSLDSQKKSFRISFNTYTPGGTFQNLEKINLNGEHNDPSIIRSKLTWSILRDFACPGPRANHAKVYINGFYYGLYINVEQIDELFIKSRFGNNDGNLFKCLYPADLVYLGKDPNLYKFSSSGHQVYDLKINDIADDYSDLARFINILNNVAVADLHMHLDSVLNTNAFLKTLCVDILSSNWDGYSFNKNNYYLYHNTQTGKFEYLAYDLDNTYGIDWFNINWGTRDIYNWSNSPASQPLYARVLQNQVYRKRFTFYMKQLLDQFFNSTYLIPKIDANKSLIQTAAENDIYRTLDYGWSISDFNNSYTAALGAHVKYGLKPYISTRYTNAFSQLESTNTAPIISYVQNSPARINQDISIKALVEDETANSTVFLKYNVNSGSFETIQMFDDGSHNDGIARDHFYGATIPALSSASEINYYVEATDPLLQTTLDPVSGYYVINISDQMSPLFINEFMASNLTNNPDEFGEFDDWIEIYNAGAVDVFLGDKYLTDNLASPKKWQMPAVSIHPNQFLVFWADGSFLTQGANHTNFKLSGSGEEIGIFDNDANGNAQIDAIIFGNQETDKSYGRYADGGNTWFVMSTPTPGASNILSGINIIDNAIAINIYPNPAQSYINIKLNDSQLSISKITIFNFNGQKIDQTIYAKTNDIEYVINRNILSNGIYTLEIEVGNSSQNFSIYKKILIL